VRNARARLTALEESQVRKPPPLLRFAGLPHGGDAPAEVPADAPVDRPADGLVHGLVHGPVDGPADASVDGHGPLISVQGAAVAGRLAPVSIDVSARSRLLVTGANGAGKSTLLAVLAGTEEVVLARGVVSRRPGVRAALLAQDVRWVHPEATVRSVYEAALGERLAERVPLVSLGLLAPRDVDRPVGALSVGQQRRVALAVIVARPPHIFLLDEPTNHLSLSLAGELEAAFGAYPGAVVVASHDRWLRRRWKGEALALG
jgi:macrolide transport system ATP-binding/permease protein